MVMCNMCTKPLQAGRNNGTKHDMCVERFTKLDKDGICVRCGKNKQKNGSIPGIYLTCADCLSSTKYECYPGPQ